MCALCDQEAPTPGGWWPMRQKLRKNEGILHRYRGKWHLNRLAFKETGSFDTRSLHLLERAAYIEMQAALKWFG